MVGGGLANHLFFPPSASLCDTRKSDSYHNGGMNHSIIEFASGTASVVLRL